MTPGPHSRSLYRPYVALLKLDSGFVDFLRDEQGQTMRYKSVSEARSALENDVRLRDSDQGGRGIVYDTNGLTVATTIAL